MLRAFNGHTPDVKLFACVADLLYDIPRCGALVSLCHNALFSCTLSARLSALRVAVIRWPLPLLCMPSSGAMSADDVRATMLRLAQVSISHDKKELTECVKFAESSYGHFVVTRARSSASQGCALPCSIIAHK